MVVGWIGLSSSAYCTPALALSLPIATTCAISWAASRMVGGRRHGRLFNAHGHMMRISHCRGTLSSFLKNGPPPIPPQAAFSHSGSESEAQH